MENNTPTNPPPAADIRHDLSSFHNATPIRAERVKINGVEVCPRPTDPAALAEVSRIEKAYDDGVPYVPAA